MEEDLEKRLEEELNEEEAADEAEDPKPKKGKKAKEEKQKISLDWEMDPIERLTVEMNSLDESAYMARAIAEYLIEEFKKDENLKESYKNRKVTLEEIVSHITKEAQKQLGSRNGQIKDEVVYGWAVHYVTDGKIPEKKSDKQVIELTVQEKADAKQQALESLTEAELERLKKKAYEDARKQAIQEERKRIEEERKAKEEQKAKEAEEKKRLREQEAARKRQSESLQMSLFDMLGGDDDAN